MAGLLIDGEEGEEGVEDPPWKGSWAGVERLGLDADGEVWPDSDRGGVVKGSDEPLATKSPFSRDSGWRFGELANMFVMSCWVARSSRRARCSYGGRRRLQSCTPWGCVCNHCYLSAPVCVGSPPLGRNETGPDPTGSLAQHVIECTAWRSRPSRISCEPRPGPEQRSAP
jgi:hypothetical protein